MKSEMATLWRKNLLFSDPTYTTVWHPATSSKQSVPLVAMLQWCKYMSVVIIGSVVAKIVREKEVQFVDNFRIPKLAQLTPAIDIPYTNSVMLGAFTQA